MATDISSIQDQDAIDQAPMDRTPSPEDESRELTDVLQRIVQNAGALLEVENCSVALSDAAGTTVITRAALENHGRTTRYTRFRLNEGVAGWVAEQRVPLVINDVRLDPRFKRLGHTPVGSMICVPLIEHSNFIGTLTASSPAINAFSPRQLQMLIIFAEQAVLAITNARNVGQIRAILAASSDGIALVGIDGRFIEVNPAFGRIFDVDPEQVIGIECDELFHCNEDNPPVPPRFSGGSDDLCAVGTALRNQQVLPYIEVDLPINGMVRSVGLSVTPVAADSTSLCLLMVRDVTTIRDATRVKAKFLSMITHELRSPLNAIHGYLDLTLSGVAGELNEQQREFVRRARAGSEHLYALVEDLLLISRADAGQLRLNREEADLQEIITNAVEELEVMAVDNGVTIAIDVADDVPPVIADPVRIQQVLRNLISNSLRFTPSGGTVTVTCRMCRDASVHTGRGQAPPAHVGAPLAGALEIQVHDTGYGIAPEYHRRIFERFYQAPPPDGTRVTGQGLGLAIVKMIVELHGGQVTVESSPGEGSTFSFMLPYLQS